jgi:two-component system chemotaxis response regulator CheY
MELNALVVDDSAIMRKMVMRSLREAKLADFIFTEAGDGVEGLEQFDADSTHMIFVDWNMPNMSGIDFVREIRSTQQRHIPIVMITTESTMDKVEEALDQVGVDCFIVKPFTPEVLQKKLEPLFEQLSESASKGGGFFGKLADKFA